MIASLEAKNLKLSSINKKLLVDSVLADQDCSLLDESISRNDQTVSLLQTLHNVISKADLDQDD